MTKRAVSVEQSEADIQARTLTDDELIRKATADRAAGRDESGEIDALLQIAANQNRAALDRLAK